MWLNLPGSFGLRFPHSGGQLLHPFELPMAGFEDQGKEPSCFFAIVITQQGNVGFADGSAVGRSIHELEVHDGRGITRMIRRCVFFQSMQIPSQHRAAPVEVISANLEVPDLRFRDKVHMPAADRRILQYILAVVDSAVSDVTHNVSATPEPLTSACARGGREVVRTKPKCALRIDWTALHHGAASVKRGLFCL